MQEARRRIKNWLKRGEFNNPINLSQLGLDELPDIPMECRKLYCFGNKLRDLPKLPNCVELRCYSNKLDRLPELPNCKHLNCCNNMLTLLPELMKCEELACSGNQLIYLPILHKDVFVCWKYWMTITYIDYMGLWRIFKGYDEDGDNLWLHIHDKFGWVESHNYYRCAMIIQKTWRRYWWKKCVENVVEYVGKNISGIIKLYIV